MSVASGSRSARLMESEISVLQVEKRIRTRVKRQMEKHSASTISTSR